MAFVRDVYYEAIYTRLQERVTGIKTWSRRHLAFSKLPSGAQPACLVLVANQQSQQQEGLPRVWTLGVDVVLFVRASGQEETLDTVLNELVDQVEQALARDRDEPSTGPFMQTDALHTTLGGLVQECSIAGPVEFFQAEAGDQATVIVPLDMVVIGDW